MLPRDRALLRDRVARARLERDPLERIRARRPEEMQAGGIVGMQKPRPIDRTLLGERGSHDTDESRAAFLELIGSL